MLPRGQLVQVVVVGLALPPRSGATRVSKQTQLQQTDNDSYDASWN